MNFIVIGGDAAGMSAASRAKRKNPELKVTVLEMTQDVSYSACGMPYNIADAERELEDLVVRKADVFRKKQGINLLTGHRAEKIDPSDQKVSGVTVDGTPFSYPYDKLLIATGASPVIPKIPGIDLPGVWVLKNLEDGRRIKQWIREKSVGKVLIVGMGYIALEMAEACKALGLEVVLVKPRNRLLPWMAEELADIVRDELESKGVELYPGQSIERIDSEGDRLSVKTATAALECDMVLVAIGVRPNSEIAARAGLLLGKNDSIAVDRQLRSSDPDIYAAGDCSDAFHVVTGEKTWIPLALRANRAGWAVADNVCGTLVELPGIAGTAVFKVFDMQVARSGLNVKEAEAAGFSPVEVVIKARSRAHAHPGASSLWVQMIGDSTSGRLLGAIMLGKEGAAHRINAVAVGLHQQMTVADFSQADLAYAPPFGPVWDPMLTAANQLLKKL